VILGRLENRVAVVTGAGRGLGRAHALHLAAEGASVVVNDLGGDVSGAGADVSPAQQVVTEIDHLGGRAIASGHDVSDWKAAEELIAFTVEAFGDLHVLVNNAGILRDSTVAKLTEDAWDSVIRVHLKGHAAPTAHAVAYWRQRSKAGQEVKASVIHTTSVAGFVGNFGQANYSAAKAAVIGLSRVVALEGRNYGIRSNAVSPSARTRITMSIPGSETRLRPPDDPDTFDAYAPENVSPLIAWLAERDCPANNQVFHIGANRLFVIETPTIAHVLESEGRWTAERLGSALVGKLVDPLPLEVFLHNREPEAD
jgi:NAD(P)-dependent dehydrogenase (short-subunit alcohol dehydrogenase family)